MEGVILLLFTMGWSVGMLQLDFAQKRYVNLEKLTRKIAQAHRDAILRLRAIEEDREVENAWTL